MEDCTSSDATLNEYDQCSFDGASTVGACAAGLLCVRKNAFYGQCVTSQRRLKNIDEEGWEGTILAEEGCTAKLQTAIACSASLPCLGAEEQCSSDGVTTTGACCAAAEQCVRKDLVSGFCRAPEQTTTLQQLGWDGAIIAEHSCSTVQAPVQICDRFQCIGTGEVCSNDGVYMLGTCCATGDICMASAGSGICASPDVQSALLEGGHRELSKTGCRAVRPDAKCNNFWNFRYPPTAAHQLTVQPGFESSFMTASLPASTPGAVLVVYGRSDIVDSTSLLQPVAVPWQPAYIKSVTPAPESAGIGSAGGDKVLVEGCNIAPSQFSTCNFTSSTQHVISSSLAASESSAGSLCSTTAECIAPALAPGAATMSVANAATHEAGMEWPLQVDELAMTFRGGIAGESSSNEHRTFLQQDNSPRFDVTLDCPAGMAVTEVLFADYGRPTTSCSSETVLIPGPDFGSCAAGQPKWTVTTVPDRDRTPLCSATIMGLSHGSKEDAANSACWAGTLADDPVSADCPVRRNECVSSASDAPCTLSAAQRQLMQESVLAACAGKGACHLTLLPDDPPGCVPADQATRWLALTYKCHAAGLRNDHITGGAVFEGSNVATSGYAWSLMVRPARVPVAEAQTILSIEAPGLTLQKRSGLIWSKLTSCSILPECGSLAYYDACINSAGIQDADGHPLEIKADDWMHVALSVTPAGEGSLHLNGTLMQRFTTLCLPTSDSLLFLAADHAGTNGASQHYFEGAIDRFLLWDTAAPQGIAQVCANTSNDNHLLVHYDMAMQPGVPLKAPDTDTCQTIPDMNLIRPDVHSSAIAVPRAAM